MPLPTAEEARTLLEQNVQDPYQRLHATMVAAAMAGYAPRFQGDPHLWRLTGLLHDIDFERFPERHPAESLRWFREWGYPEEMIHAVEAHARLGRLHLFGCQVAVLQFLDRTRHEAADRIDIIERGEPDRQHGILQLKRGDLAAAPLQFT